MSDSVGIFYINMPGEYTLTKGIRHLTDAEPEGILHQPPAAVAGTEAGDGFDRIEVASGPGMSLRTYLPKNEESLRRKLLPPLSPSEAPLAAMAAAGDRSCGK